MNKNVVKAAVKFIVVGGLSTLLNYLVFYILVKLLQVNYIIASVTGYLSGLVFGFFLNNSWTFQQYNYNRKKIIGYGIVYLVSLGLSTLFLWICVDKFHLNKYLMNVASICLSTVSNFIGLNYIIYKRNDEE